MNVTKMYLIFLLTELLYNKFKFNANSSVFIKKYNTSNGSAIVVSGKLGR